MPRQLQQKDLESVIAHNDIAKSVEQSWMQLESLINVNQDSVLVLNSLSWDRSGWVYVDLPDERIIVDAATKQPVPQTILRHEAGISIPRFGSPTNRVRFQTADVPDMGYGTFIIRTAEGPTAILTSSAPNTPVVQLEIRLPSSRKSIELTYKVQKTATLCKESASCAFYFAGRSRISATKRRMAGSILHTMNSLAGAASGMP